MILGHVCQPAWVHPLGGMQDGKLCKARQGLSIPKALGSAMHVLLSSVPRGSSEVRIASARRLEIRIGASEAAAAAGIGIRETESEKRERSGRGRRAQS